MAGRRNRLEFAGALVFLLLAMFCAVFVSLGSIQASGPVSMPQSFAGEYSYDGETWRPLTPESRISALDGDLYLRGHFERDIRADQILCGYRNHIGVTLWCNGEQIFADAVSESSGIDKRMFASMCGQTWADIDIGEITSQDRIGIRLYNPHRMGNETAYRDFLDTLCVSMPGTDFLQKQLSSCGAPFRIAGSVCIVFSLMILGAAMAARIMGIPAAAKWFKQGVITFCMGGFILFDVLDVSFWNELVALNTYGRHLCMMAAVYFAGQLVSDALTGHRRQITKIALGVSCILNVGLIAASVTGLTVIFDTLPWWTGWQMVLCPVLMVCCGLEMARGASGDRLTPVSGILMFGCLLPDIFGLGGSIVMRNPHVKIMFGILFVLHGMYAARWITLNYRASMRAEKLEQELENSRISIMLSQIRPHFLYNVLGTIRGLCREDPMQAHQALGDFSDYLRGNMSALSNSSMILFSVELLHIEAYLRLEKMRMGEDLNVCYDIQEKDFFIPPLTIQPLVENAVKHGLFEKGGGTLRLHTRREGEEIMILVQDDGAGFDPDAPVKQDGHHAHVGLINVRRRLEKMSGGKLTIDTALGRGTAVTVRLKENRGKEGRGSDEHTGR